MIAHVALVQHPTMRRVRLRHEAAQPAVLAADPVGPHVGRRAPGHPRLHAHPARVDPQRWQHTAPAGAWWRTEHQTFIPLPAHAQAVFTIHVEVQPLADALDTPKRAAALHDAIASMSPAVLAYRSLAGVRDALLAWLAQRAAQDAGSAAPVAP